MPSAAEFSIRRGAPADAGLLAELSARLFIQAYGDTHPEPELSRYLAREFSLERLLAVLRHPAVTVFLAQDATPQPIGYAYLRETLDGRPAGLPGERPCEVVRFYVEAAWHGRGVAGGLMAACEAEALRRGADTLWLGVWQRAPRPIAFYRRAGFEVVGVTKFHFGERLDDDYVMARVLSGPASH
jgi:ribosomal protein S18 acetylase RimI-like enzyme